MASKNEKIKELLVKIEEGTKLVFDSDNYKNYLNTMAKFHNYSHRNILLIMYANPDAAAVAGYRAWQTKFNRHVKKGETGIPIIAYTPKTVETTEESLQQDGSKTEEKITKKIPYFSIKYVYDISQTEGEPLPKLVNELVGDVADYDYLLTSIQMSTDFDVSFGYIDGNAKGYCDPKNNKIVIKDGISQMQAIKTTVHEVAHAHLHAPAVTMEEKLSRASKEIEAESIAYIVCAHYGLDTSGYSFSYLASWSSGKELKELQASLETIQKAASELINTIDKNLESLLVDRNIIPSKPAAEESVTEKLLKGSEILTQNTDIGFTNIGKSNPGENTVIARRL